MNKSRVLAGALAVGALTIASLFAAAPANAATLPEGQKITVIESETAQFSFANPETAALTNVGTENPAELEGDTLTGVDVNDDGVGYAIGTYYTEGPQGAYLYAADAANGVIDYLVGIDFFFGDFPLEMDECTGIDFTAGQLLLACAVYGEGAAFFIGYWDFDLGMAVPLIELNGDPEIDPGPENPNEPEDGFDFRYITALAVDPVTGVIWAFTNEQGYYGVYTASEDAGLTPVTDTNDQRVDGADFDRGGQLWVTTYRDQQIDRAIEPGDAGLATLDPATGTFPFTAAWEDQEQLIWPITVWGKPTLPATGPADLSVPIGAAALLLLAGTILAGVTVLRRRQEA